MMEMEKQLTVQAPAPQLEAVKAPNIGNRSRKLIFMSISYFIGPFDPALWKHGNPSPEPETSLRIDPAEYRESLLVRWPTAREWKSESFAGGYYWTLDEYNLHGIEVHLHKDLQYVSFSSYGVNLVEFILWHREYVSPDHDLYLFNSSSWDSLLLTPETQKQGVIEFCGLSGTELVLTSPLNGTWDGSLVLSVSDYVNEYLLTLHLSEYVDRVQAELLIFGKPFGGVFAKAELTGSPSNDQSSVLLIREGAAQKVGNNLDPSIESFDALRLIYQSGESPKLKGNFLRKQQDGYANVGEMCLSRRGLYDPPPHQSTH